VFYILQRSSVIVSADMEMKVWILMFKCSM